MFQQPPSTRFDLNFSVAGFAVKVHPLFWLMGVLFGASLGRLDSIAIWVAVLFISILIHELGHSLMMRKYGVDSSIVLYHLGGLAIPKSSRRSELSWIEQILISLAGPFAGFFFAGLIIAIVKVAGGFVVIDWMYGFLPIPYAIVFRAGDLVNEAIGFVLWICAFWGFINLLPVFPLDGGRVSQQLFIRFDPWNGFRNALWLSVVTGAILAIVGIAVFNSIYMAFLFGILALQSYQIIQGGVGPRF
jgi:stage IV sporulation protein FB